jgi:hypothetical protein
MSNIRGIIVGIATAVVATAFGTQSAFAATIIGYTGESVTAGDSITITSPHSVSGEAGQIKLTGVSGLGPSTTTILAWCLDVYDFLQHSGTFSGAAGPVSSSGTNIINGSNQNKIGGLMAEGNTAILNHSTLTFGQTNFNMADISAAIQVAIWSAEYSNFNYSLIDGHDKNTNFYKDFQTMVLSLTGSAQSGIAYNVLTDADGLPTNQTLGTLSPVPGPILGGGLPGLILAASGIFGWWRRKRVALA